MSEDSPPPSRPRKTFQPLKPTSTRIERLDEPLIDPAARTDPAAQSSEPEVVSPGPELKPLAPLETVVERVTESIGEAKPGREIEPLPLASTRTESAGPASATPLLLDEASQTSSSPGSDSHAYEEGLGELRGLVRSLRSRNQILRTERTSIAGRKYALEVVIETLREKLTAVMELVEGLEAPGELGAALAGIREIVGDARRIADSKSILDADLEAERASFLEERRQIDEKLSELNEALAGTRSERDSLQEELARLSQELQQTRQHNKALAQRFTDLEDELGETRDALQDGEQTTAELATIQSQLDAAAARVAAGAARAEAAEVASRTAEARAFAAAERLTATQHEAEQARDRASHLEGELGPLRALAAEQRDALLEVQPVVEDWSRLEKENHRLARLVGEARERGRVDVQELLARAALLKRLERLTRDPGTEVP